MMDGKTAFIVARNAYKGQLSATVDAEALKKVCAYLYEYICDLENTNQELERRVYGNGIDGTKD